MKVKTKSRKVDKAWLADHVNDPYVKLAQKEGYRSRAAYKLKEIDEQLRLVRPGQTVVDLGSAPGAWSQYLRRRMALDGGIAGRLVAVDLLPMAPVDGAEFIEADFRDDSALQKIDGLLDGRAVDLVVSDMAPNLSGVAVSDAARMTDLVELAVDFSMQRLGHEGALVAKVFHGSGYSQLAELFKRNFRTARPIQPKASRGRSAETYLVGIAPKRLAARPAKRISDEPENARGPAGSTAGFEPGPADISLPKP